MNANPESEHIRNAALIDDEAVAILALRALVQTYCPSVRIIASASTMPAAMAIARSGEADLLFVDIELPGGSGFEVADAARECGASIVFLSAHNRRKEAHARFPDAGFLTKPVSIEELRAAVAASPVSREEEEER